MAGTRFFWKIAVLWVIVLQAPASLRGEEPRPSPSWYNQRKARTYTLQIPAPRGQITDRHGRPLAQNKVCYNLAIRFPSPLDMGKEQAWEFCAQRLSLIKALSGLEISLSPEEAWSHYQNRGFLPMVVWTGLTDAQMSQLSKGLASGLALVPSYERFYPEGSLASHALGYVGKRAPLSKKPVENGDLMFPESEGRDGLEQVFDDELRGTPGTVSITVSPSGQLETQMMIVRPIPGYNVITTLDLDVQRACESALADTGSPSSAVVLDPSNGEVLAMASNPSFNPNDFVPAISEERYNKLRDDPSAPLFPRSFRGEYPPGSTFKAFVALAALESGAITQETVLPCPASISVGNVVFGNWKKSDSGDMDLTEALAQSCNTWFYQVGLRTGAPALVNMGSRLGFGRRTGIPLRNESSGRLPDDRYMLETHGRTILRGDVANLSIGQGDLLVTPLQMAQAMGIAGFGGNFSQTRLVRQVQSLDNTVVSAYPPRINSGPVASLPSLAAVREGLLAVVKQGTGTRASVKKFAVAGKTGSAQWGPTSKKKVAAWFAGFAPAASPRYAFSVVVEGSPGEDLSGGRAAAPVAGSILKKLFEKEESLEMSPEQTASPPPTPPSVEDGETPGLEGPPQISEPQPSPTDAKSGAPLPPSPAAAPAVHLSASKEKEEPPLAKEAYPQPEDFIGRAIGEISSPSPQQLPSPEPLAREIVDSIDPLSP